MKRYIGIALVLCALGVGFVTAQTKKTVGGEDAIVQADHTVVRAFEKSDKATLAKLLDADFSWIDTDGITALYVRMWDFGNAVVAIMCQPT